MENRIIFIQNKKEPQSQEAVENLDKKTRVAAYCRVSTLAESQDESFETQRQSLESIILADPKLELVRIYGDQGISGATMKHRPEFQQMLEDCKAGKIDMIITKSISRFTRNLADCMDVVRQLRELGIPVLFEREGINTLTNSGEMLLSVLASIAQEEINNMSQNIRWAHDRNNAVGNPTMGVRYGYRKKREGAKHLWIIYEPEARRVRHAFQKADEGWSYQEILNELNSIEYREGSGKSWSLTRVKNMLSCEAYIGDILTNKRFTPDYLQKKSLPNRGQRPQYYLEGHHEPIITKEQFERVGEKIKNGLLKNKYRNRR